VIALRQTHKRNIEYNVLEFLERFPRLGINAMSHNLVDAPRTPNGLLTASYASHRSVRTIT
jgi:hypothetical protein